jgi:hypothetical protein
MILLRQTEHTWTFNVYIIQTSMQEQWKKEGREREGREEERVKERERKKHSENDTSYTQQVNLTVWCTWLLLP